MRKNVLILCLVFLPVFWTAVSSAVPPGDKETIRQSLDFGPSAGTRGLDVDNVFGSIKVQGYSGSKVELTAVRSVQADSGEKLAAAQAEVVLNVFNKDGFLHIYVDGPFRSPEGKIQWNTEELGYTVQYDIELKVPYQAEIKLKTINDGDILASDLDGPFTVNNVNGKITLSGMGGAGLAHTVNGPVKVAFKQNPESECSFKTINGDVELLFPQAPAADFQVKTFNGEILSDFPVTDTPAPPARGDRQGKKFVYEGNRFQAFRTGRGGIPVKMETLNGDIIIAAGR